MKLNHEFLKLHFSVNVDRINIAPILINFVLHFLTVSKHGARQLLRLMRMPENKYHVVKHLFMPRPLPV